MSQQAVTFKLAAVTTWNLNSLSLFLDNPITDILYHFAAPLKKIGSYVKENTQRYH
jgi:hypothetical protein